MNAATHHSARRRAIAGTAGVAFVALLAVLVAAFAGRPDAETPSGSLTSAPARSIELVVGDETAIATLDDTPPARDFAAMLPIRVVMKDPFGQAKTGQLEGELDVGGASRSRSYTAGEISYWSPSGKLAIIYDALGRSVPPPGLVRIGTVDAGLRIIASAGNDFTMTIRAGTPARARRDCVAAAQSRRLRGDRRTADERRVAVAPRRGVGHLDAEVLERLDQIWPGPGEAAQAYAW